MAVNQTSAVVVPSIVNLLNSTHYYWPNQSSIKSFKEPIDITHQKIHSDVTINSSSVNYTAQSEHELKNSPFDITARKAESPPSAVKGEIDYVLLPLVFLGVAGPIFVVMYVVMAAIEFKLPPNVQQKRGKSYWLSEKIWETAPTGVKEMSPWIDSMSTAMSRVWSHEQCKEKLSCQLAFISRQFRVSWIIDKILEYDMFITGMIIFSPKDYQKPMKVFSDNFRSDAEFESCAVYECL